jgi:hypothetical protein
LIDHLLLDDVGAESSWISLLGKYAMIARVLSSPSLFRRLYVPEVNMYLIDLRVSIVRDSINHINYSLSFHDVTSQFS